MTTLPGILRPEIPCYLIADPIATIDRTAQTINGLFAIH
jgi:hypothetical protein